MSPRIFSLTTVKYKKRTRERLLQNTQTHTYNSGGVCTAILVHNYYQSDRDSL